MSSTDCPNCVKVNEVMSDQKNKMALIEVRLRDLVKAYKKVCSERDNLLAISSATVLPINDSHEQQKRLSSLEASVAEMSAICGKYESQSFKDQQLIHELTQRCEQLTNELKLHETSAANTREKSHKSEKTYRHRGIQTEESMESSDETKTDVLTDSVKDVKHMETQTDFVSEFDVFNGSHHKKSELAIVLPTLSQTQPNDCESDLDDLSDRSRSRANSIGSNGLDNYPVFETHPRETAQSSNELFVSNNSSGVSLFYANELARKEIDLAETRLQARENECALRELQWKYNTDKYKLQTRITDLERNLSQMSSNQPLSQLNVTYIRNVLMKLLNTKDKHQKQFMINAILTALDQKDKKPK
ncbi:unnamed protein product [Oppiella nova]|uniref:GRIP domain-containing protein n=1 Tax=Oppiella nova TaxID=334625 RepID=A0A7R9QHG4_9ACAR|nr:unnamed protein product [Oppiella nova]CAG2165080.1 unnamed protein product [Oppiella nova]